MSERAHRSGPPQASSTPAASLLGEAGGFYALVLPMVISRLGLAAMSIVDGVMLARYSSQSLAVHGLGDALAGRLLDICMALVLAGMALAAQAAAGGAAQRQQVGQVWWQAMLLGGLAGGAGLALCALGPWLLLAGGQAPALAQASGQVIWILGLGLLPALLALATAGMLEAVGRSGTVALAVVAGNLLNLGLNWLLIDGVAGVLPGGAAGVAIATTTVRWLLALGLLYVAWTLPSWRSHGLRRGPAPGSWRAGAEQRARGLSAAATVCVLAGLTLGLPLMAGRMGAAELAALTALFLVLAPCMVSAWGMSDAAGLRVAALLGQDGGGGALRRTGQRLAVLSALALLAMGLLLRLVQDSLLPWAVQDSALVDAVARLLPLGLAAVLADGLSFACGSALRSLGVLRAPFVVHLVVGLLLLPLAAGLAFWAGWGVAGLVAAMALTGLLRFALLAWLYHREAGTLDRAQARDSDHRTATALARPLSQTH